MKLYGHRRKSLSGEDISPMKITGVKSYLKWTGNRNWVFVRIDTDEGVYGIGEGFSLGPDKAAAEVIDYFGEWLIGMDPMDTEKIQKKLLYCSRFPAGSLMFCAISAIDIALWDIKGKALGQPIYKLLGGATRDKVWCYCHAFGKTTEESIESLISKKEKYGYVAAKGSPRSAHPGSRPYGAGLKAYVQFYQAVRDALGDEYEIGSDISAKIYEPYEALELCRVVQEYRPMFIEEPIQPTWYEAFADIKKKAQVPIATGEQIYRYDDWYRLVNMNCCDIIQPDITLCGGFTGMMKIANMAEFTPLRVSPHNPLSGVQQVANVHISMAMPNFNILEHEPKDSGMVAEMLTEVIPVKDGYTRPNDKPGLGIDFDWDYFDKIADYKAWSRATTFGSGVYDHDGSIHIF